VRVTCQIVQVLYFSYALRKGKRATFVRHNDGAPRLLHGVCVRQRLSLFDDELGSSFLLVRWIAMTPQHTAYKPPQIGF
jgi:hypothetical protein